MLSSHCYIPSLGHVVIQAARTQQAGVLFFLTPLQSSCSGQHNPQEEGKEAESMVMARLGVEWGVLGLEQSNVSQISRSYGSQVL